MSSDPQHKFRTHILAVAQALKAEEARRREDLAGVTPSPDVMTSLVAAISRLQAPAEIVAGTTNDLPRLAGLCAAARVLKNGITQVADLLALGAILRTGEKTRVVRPCPPEIVAGLLGFGPRDPTFIGSNRRR